MKTDRENRPLRESEWQEGCGKNSHALCLQEVLIAAKAVLLTKCIRWLMIEGA